MKRLFIHLGILLIMAGFSIICVENVSAAIKSYGEDVEKSNRILRTIDSDYSAFKEGAESVKNDIVDASKSFNFYLNQFLKKNPAIVSKLNNIEEKISGLSTVTGSLIENCKYDLNNSSMESKCRSFKANYLNMIQSYYTLVDEYNKIIKSYNSYAKKNKIKTVETYLYNLSFEINGLVFELE